MNVSYNIHSTDVLHTGRAQTRAEVFSSVRNPLVALCKLLKLLPNYFPEEFSCAVTLLSYIVIRAGTRSLSHFFYLFLYGEFSSFSSLMCCFDYNKGSGQRANKKIQEELEAVKHRSRKYCSWMYRIDRKLRLEGWLKDIDWKVSWQCSSLRKEILINKPSSILSLWGTEG